MDPTDSNAHSTHWAESQQAESMQLLRISVSPKTPEYQYRMNDQKDRLIGDIKRYYSFMNSFERISYDKID